MKTNEIEKVPGQFTGMCWRCWPKLGCKCAPDETEVDQLKSERLIAEMAYAEEKKRRQGAESVICQILDDAGSGEITLPTVIALAKEHAQKFGQPPNTR